MNLLPPDVEAVALKQVMLMLRAMQEYLTDMPWCVPAETHDIAREASQAVLLVMNPIGARLNAITDPSGKLDGY